MSNKVPLSRFLFMGVAAIVVFKSMETINVAQTPVVTGTAKNQSLLGLRKTVAASSFVFLMRYSGDVRRLAIFATVALVVPPPVGLVSGVLAVGFYEAAKASGRACRDMMGIPQPEDFEALAEVNRRYKDAHREIVALPRYQKTVFPAVEMR